MNYQKLIKDAQDGNLRYDPSIVKLRMDNDGGYWEVLGDLDYEEARDVEDKIKEIYGLPDGYRDIVEVLNAAGVNCDWC